MCRGCAARDAARDKLWARVRAELAAAVALLDEAHARLHALEVDTAGPTRAVTQAKQAAQPVTPAPEPVTKPRRRLRSEQQMEMRL